MENVIEVTQETRKDWSTPELKKVDIEQITAGNTNSGGKDGVFLS